MDRNRRLLLHPRLTHTGARRALASAATLAVAAAGTTGCAKTVVGSLAHHLEPGLGANFGVTNHTKWSVARRGPVSARCVPACVNLQDGRNRVLAESGT